MPDAKEKNDRCILVETNGIKNKRNLLYFIDHELQGDVKPMQKVAAERKRIFRSINGMNPALEVATNGIQKDANMRNKNETHGGYKQRLARTDTDAIHF